MNRQPVYFIVLLFLLAFTVQTVFGVGLPGTLDTTFGGTGIVFTTFDTFTAQSGNDIVVQPDGKIIVAGSAVNNSTSKQNWVMARYNPDGSLDTTFGTGGRVITPILNQSDTCNSVTLQPDGKIVAAGVAGVNFFSSYAAIARFNPDGSLDSSFGSGGKTLRELSGMNSVQDVVVLANGKIFIVGANGTHIGVPFGILFNSSGSEERYMSIDATYLSAVASQPDGKVLIAGRIGSSDYTIWRFNTDGSPDTSFDGDGKVSVQVGTNTFGARGILVKPDGKILTVGTARFLTADVALIQFNPDGSLDTTFDDDGKVFVNVTGAEDYGIDLALQADGKIIALGASGSTFEIIRLRPNGALDTAFAGDGVATITVRNISASAVAIQPDGKIVATGASSESGFGTVRFNGGVARSPFDFDGDSKTDLSIFRPGPGEWWYNRSSNGGNTAFQFGAGTDTIAPADFTGDGKTDVAFFRPSTGQWFVLRSEDFSFYAFPFGTNGDVPVPADYDADGKADAAVFRPSTLTWFIQKSGGGTDIIGFGAAGDVPTVADYDGDGKADIAIYRPNAVGGSQWWVRRSSNASVFALQFGTSTDKTVQGDYTGDGKADFAFWRPSTGGWFILRSEDFSFYSFPFGTNGDIPVPGDYDGDGRNDAAVFRPSTSTWFAQRSTAGTLIQQFGIAGDIPLPSAYVR